jgi:hypothetical protein
MRRNRVQHQKGLSDNAFERERSVQTPIAR